MNDEPRESLDKIDEHHQSPLIPLPDHRIAMKLCSGYAILINEIMNQRLQLTRSRLAAHTIAPPVPRQSNVLKRYYEAVT